MNQCKDCYWATPPANQPKPANAGWLICDLAESSDGIATQESALMNAIDGEQYHGFLMVSPDFGCIQWSAEQPDE